jgi:hypothetical protein
MKLQSVLGSDETYKRISIFAKPLGFEIICYHQILKAMENIEEINPHAIVISARDFPQQWKEMVQFVRKERPKHVCPIILFKGENFSIEEASEASFLGVSGIVAEALNDPGEVSRFQAILGRYLPVDDKRRTRRFSVEPWQRLGFVFSNPADLALVSGEIKDISSGGLSFLPDSPLLMNDIGLNTELTECSLRAGDYFLSPVCRLARTGRIVSMEFLSFPEQELETWKTYMESFPLLGLKHIEKP